MTTSPAKPSASKKQGIVETAKTIIYAVIIAVIVRMVVIEPFNIPSKSMLPGLLVGDYLFVTKFTYGYSRHSFSLFGVSLPFSFGGKTNRVFHADPGRGDVAVFKLPRDSRTDYIKRIIGLPGDRIQVKGGVLHINGEPVRRERIEDFIDVSRNGGVRRIPQYIETLPNGRRHRILERSDTESLSDNTQVYVVPPGHYFAMGDNRDDSQDSRFPDVGFIPAENLVGRAWIIFFSMDGKVRFDRFFKEVR